MELGRWWADGLLVARELTCVNERCGLVRWVSEIGGKMRVLQVAKFESSGLGFYVRGGTQVMAVLRRILAVGVGFREVFAVLRGVS